MLYWPCRLLPVLYGLTFICASYSAGINLDGPKGHVGQGWGIGCDKDCCYWDLTPVHPAANLCSAAAYLEDWVTSLIGMYFWVNLHRIALHIKTELPCSGMCHWTPVCWRGCLSPTSAEGYCYRFLLLGFQKVSGLSLWKMGCWAGWIFEVIQQDSYRALKYSGTVSHGYKFKVTRPYKLMLCKWMNDHKSESQGHLIWKQNSFYLFICRSA